jgi:hypothetical protein
VKIQKSIFWLPVAGLAHFAPFSAWVHPLAPKQKKFIK